MAGLKGTGKSGIWQYSAYPDFFNHLLDWQEFGYLEFAVKSLSRFLYSMFGLEGSGKSGVLELLRNLFKDIFLPVHMKMCKFQCSNRQEIY